MPRTIKPLCHHKTKNLWYKVIDGKTRYFGKQGDDFATAYAEYQASCNPVVEVWPAGDGAVLKPDLPQETVDRLTTDEPYFFEQVLQRFDATANLPQAERHRQLRGIVSWMLQTMRPAPTTPIVSGRRPKATGMRLSEILAFWQSCRNGKGKDHTRQTTNRFNMFTTNIGDICFCELSEDHIRQFIASIADKSPNNQKKILTAVKLVLNFTLTKTARRNTVYPAVKASLPVDLRSLTILLNVEPDDLTAPDKSHTKPFPAKEYKAITKLATKRKDKRFLSVWYLACQCGLNLTDFARLTWGESMLLDADVPHVNLARLKRGKGERVIPLASATVKALKEYRKTLPEEKRADGKSVFYGIDVYVNLPPTDNMLRDEFQEYRTAAKVDGKWLYKHLRNVGPNLRVKAGLGIDAEWAFLGHSYKLGEAQKYEYAEPGRLLPLVNAIAADYF